MRCIEIPERSCVEGECLPQGLGLLLDPEQNDPISSGDGVDSGGSQLEHELGSLPLRQRGIGTKYCALHAAHGPGIFPHSPGVPAGMYLLVLKQRT